MKIHTITARSPGLADRLRQSRFWLVCTGFWLFNIVLLLAFQSQGISGGELPSLREQAIFLLSQELSALLFMPLLVAGGVAILQQSRKTVISVSAMLLVGLLAVSTETLLVLYWILLTPSKLASLFAPQLTNIPDAFSWYLTQNYLQSDVYKYLFCLAVSVALYWQEQNLGFRSRQRELEDKLQFSDLALQRAYLNPHFLFNSLNSIAALVRTERSPQALEAITELSQLLREILANRMQEFRSLDSELSLIAHYIHLQKLRFGEKLQFDVEVAEQAQKVRIPTLLLLTQIENAIKHGARSLCQITLSVSITEHKLIIQLSNTQDEQQQSQTGFGIGLSNNQKRLELLYQNDFTFETQDNGDEFVVITELPVTAQKQ